MAGSSSTDIWAVGIGTDASNQTTALIEHWGGTAWSVIPANVPAGTTYSFLYGIAIVSTNDVWAVGAYESGASIWQQTLIEHWDGSAWTVVLSPNVDSGRHHALRAISAGSATNIWAVGTYQSANGGDQTLTMHWDGTLWSIVPSPNPAPPLQSNRLWGVSVGPCADAWAVGEMYIGGLIGWVPLAMHWNGSSWTVIPTPQRAMVFHDVLVFASTDIWVAAVDYEVAGGHGGAMLHWDGINWAISTTTNQQMLDATAVAPNNIWAVGGEEYGLVEHWDGVGWTFVTTSPLSEQLYGVTAFSDADAWAVGGGFAPYGLHTIIQHYSCPLPTNTPTVTRTPGTPTNTPTRTASPTRTSSPTRTPTPAGPPPVAIIGSPADGITVTTSINITGTASSSTLRNWMLDYRTAGDATWVTLGTSVTSVVSGTLGTFDPSLLLNGIYEFRLTATDVSGRVALDTARVVVEGQQKIGNFTLSFNDLEIPVAGLPIQVVRTYDSRDKRVGDFGVGWRLGVNSIRLQETGVLGTDWQQTTDGAFIPTYCIEPTRSHIVTITMPDGRVYKFSPTTSPSCHLIFPFMVGEQVGITYQPLPGTNGTLVPLDTTTGNVDYFGGPVGPIQIEEGAFSAPIDPDLYELTLEDGTMFVISRQHGLESMSDTNGNQLTISQNGIIHSSGKSVTFTRDAQSRITRITDPATHHLDYVYNTNGDLVTATDQTGASTTFTYDSNHNLLTIHDPLGRQIVRNDYDANGRLVATTDALGNSVQVTHNIGDHQEVIRDRLGHIMLYNYDDRGNILAKTDPLGNTTTYTYDSLDNKLSETDPLGNTTTFTYDTRHNLLTQTDPLGHITRYSYNDQNRLLTLTDARGNTSSNTYDGSGNLLTTHDPLGNTNSFVYNTDGTLRSTTNALGLITQYQYDANGNVTRELDPLGHATLYSYDTNGNQQTSTITRTLRSGVVETLITTSTYDARNHQVSTTYPDGSTTGTQYNSLGQRTMVTDELGHHTSFTYDIAGRLVATIYPDGMNETTTYDAEGHQLISTDRGGRVTNYTYDPLGQVLQTTFPDGTTTSSTYDADGRQVSTVDGRGNTTVYSFDAAGHPTLVTNSLNQTTQHMFDAQGNEISVTDALNHTTSFAYDANNRRTQVTYADGTARIKVYDAQGRNLLEIDQAGRTTHYTYDALGRLGVVTDALGETTAYTYDEVGNRTGQTDANGHITTFDYDRRGRVTKHTLPLGQFETFTFDAAGNQLSKMDFNGATSQFSYDSMNRLLSKTYPDSSSISFTYTVNGQRATATDSHGTTTYAYDARDRLLNETGSTGQTISYAYDAAGNRISVTTSIGTTHYSYNALNQLSTVTAPDGGATDYTYDAVGNRATLVYPNGTTASYTFDALNHLTQLINRRSDSSLISGYSYLLGPSGNRLQIVESTGRTIDYGYDNVYRLTQELITDPTLGDKTLDYTYDSVGNRLTKTEDGVTTDYTYDSNDRLLSASGTTYAYDANGNTTAELQSDETHHAYQYDFENRLVHITTSAPNQQNTFANYLYDVDGIRVQSVVNGAAQINYVVDHNLPFAQVLLEIDSIGAIKASYIYGDDLISLTRGNATSFYHYDGHMNTVQLTNVEGLVTDQYLYDAFGVLLHTVATTENQYLYTTEQFDPNIKSYYLRARYYNQQVGRFLSQDAFQGNIFDPSSLHKYSYVGNDPINASDPSGNDTLLEIGIASAAESILEAYAAIAHGPVHKLVGATKCIYCLIEPGYRLQFLAIRMLTGANQVVEDDALRIIDLSQEMIEKGYYELSSALEPATGIGEEIKNMQERIDMQLGETSYRIPGTENGAETNFTQLVRLLKITKSLSTFVKEFSDEENEQGGQRCRILLGAELELSILGAYVK